MNEISLIAKGEQLIIEIIQAKSMNNNEPLVVSGTIVSELIYFKVTRILVNVVTALPCLGFNMKINCNKDGSIDS